MEENFFRGPGEDVSGTYKEWVHFCLFGEHLQVIVNLHIHWRKSSARSTLIPQASVAFLIRRPGKGWSGALETYSASELRLRPGLISLRMGPNAIEYESGKYKLDCRSINLGIQLQCELTPRCRPFSANSVLLDGDRSLRWCTVPSLDAKGSLIENGASLPIGRMPAYHDHNWGRFLWGGDYAWEWATLAPPADQSGFSIVYSRLTDRGRHKILSQSLLVWKDGKLWKRFINEALSVRQSGLLEQKKPLRIPPILKLGASGSVFDLPKVIDLSARDAEVSIHFVLSMDDRAEIAVPADGGLSGLSILSEVHAQGELEITGAEISERIIGMALVEFNRAAH